MPPGSNAARRVPDEPGVRARAADCRARARRPRSKAPARGTARSRRVHQPDHAVAADIDGAVECAQPLRVRASRRRRRRTCRPATAISARAGSATARCVPRNGVSAARPRAPLAESWRISKLIGARLPDQLRNGRVRDDAVLVRDRDRADADETGERGRQHAVPCGAGGLGAADASGMQRKLRQRGVDRTDGAVEMVAEDEGEVFGAALPSRAALPGGPTRARRRAAAVRTRNTPANRLRTEARNRSGPSMGASDSISRMPCSSCGDLPGSAAHPLRVCLIACEL